MSGEPMTAMILIPCYRSISPIDAGASEAPVSTLLRELLERGWDIRSVTGCASIDLARNVLAAQALAHDDVWHLWLDTDISMSADDAERLVRSAQHCDADIMAADYPSSSGLSTVISSPICECDSSGVQAMRYCGFGATVTRRDTFERLSESLPLTSFGGDVTGYPYFLPRIYLQQYLAEDYAFCQRAFEANLRLLVDHSVRPQHVKI